jgi:hypothetical protein
MVWLSTFPQYVESDVFSFLQPFQVLISFFFVEEEQEEEEEEEEEEEVGEVVLVVVMVVARVLVVHQGMVMTVKQHFHLHLDLY